MGLYWYNCNYVGIYFGGSLYSMMDLFYMLMLMNNLGCDYIVWDKGVMIDFFCSGKGWVFVEFELIQVMIDEVIVVIVGGEKYLFIWEVIVCDGVGEVVVRVEKVFYVWCKVGEKQL